MTNNYWIEIHRKMQNDFNKTVDWTFRNSLWLNHSKTKAIIFGSRHRLGSVSDVTQFEMRGQKIHFVKSHLYLGVMLHATMSL